MRRAHVQRLIPYALPLVCSRNLSSCCKFFLQLVGDSERTKGFYFVVKKLFLIKILKFSVKKLKNRFNLKKKKQKSQIYLLKGKRKKLKTRKNRYQ